MTDTFHILLSFLLIIFSIIAILLKNLKTCSFFITLIGIVLALEFVLLGAYIIAIAEIGFVSCITTILLIKTINETEQIEECS